MRNNRRSRIESAIGERTKPLRLVRRNIEHFRQSVAGAGSTEQEAQAFEFIVMGMLINQGTLVWLAQQAEYGLSQEKGRMNARDSKRDAWAEKQQRARDELTAIECDPNYKDKGRTTQKKAAAASLGIGIRTLETWLKGGR